MPATRITTEENFLNQCEPAGRILNHVEQEESGDSVQWFFDECWADYSAPKFTALFKSYKTPEYADYLLSVEASKDQDGGWLIRRVKREPE